MVSTRRRWIVVVASIVAMDCRPTPTPAPPSAPPEVATRSAPEPPVEASPYADLPPPPLEPSSPEPLQGSGLAWSTEVTNALEALDFPEPNDQTTVVRFTLRICKDGSFEPVLEGGTAATPLEEEALSSLRSAKIPAPPPHVLGAMPSDCAKLKYTFEWSVLGIR